MKNIISMTVIVLCGLSPVFGAEIERRRIVPNLSLQDIHDSGHAINAVTPSSEIGWYIGFGSAADSEGRLIVNDPFIALIGNMKTEVAGELVQLMSGGVYRYERITNGLILDVSIIIVDTDVGGVKRIDHHLLKVRVTKMSSTDVPVAEILAE